MSRALTGDERDLIVRIAARLPDAERVRLLALLDRDGTKVTILLHADENGRLFEMELIRWDEQPLVAPDWRTLELY